MKRIKRYLKRLLKIIKRPEVRVLPGQIAFFIVLSVVPLIALIGCLCSLFHVSLSGIVGVFLQTVPEAVINILKPAFTEPGFTAGFSIIVGFIMASNGTHSIIVASNMLFKIDTGNYLARRIKAFFMLIILIMLFFFNVVIMGWGNVILEKVLSLQILSHIAEYVYMLFISLKWPVAIIFIFVMIKLLYTMALDQNVPSKYMNKGALFSTTGCLLVTAIYSYYVSNFANYSKFYGNLANIVVLMMWVYIIAYIFVIGIAINSDIYNVEKSTIDKKD